MSATQTPRPREFPPTSLTFAGAQFGPVVNGTVPDLYPVHPRFIQAKDLSGLKTAAATKQTKGDNLASLLPRVCLVTERQQRGGWFIS